ncbi:MAG: hypothetical protein ACE5KJ_08820 [Candidatus Zixiibacteriota bacterium]
MSLLKSSMNKLAREIFETHKGEIDREGIVAIDIDEKKIIDVVDETETLSLIQRLAKEYPSNRIYLLKTDTSKPVVWTR